MAKNIDNLYQAKSSLRAFLNYNRCNKDCELPNVSCTCLKDCMSKNQAPNTYSIDDVNNGIEYVLDFLERTGKEMVK